MKRALRGRPLCLLCIGLILVLWICKACGFPVFGEPALLTDPSADSFLSGTVHVSGRVTERRERDDYTQYVLSDSFLITSDQTISLNKTLITADSEDFAALGAQVEWIGELSAIEEPANPGQFDTKSYYACRDIYFRMKGKKMIPLTSGGGFSEFLLQLREACTQQLTLLMTEDSAGILSAMLFGEKDLLTEESKSDFQTAGMMHMLCILGLHISLLGLAIYRLLLRLRLPIPAAALLAVFLMILYGIFVGSPVSALRAILMFAVSLGAKVLLTGYDMFSSLSLAAILLLLTQPHYLFYCGFQLSFGAVLGMSLIRPMLEELHLLQLQKEEDPPSSLQRQKLRKVRDRLRLLMRSGILSWLAVMLVTLPILMWNYYELLLWSCLLNLLLLPAAGFLMSSGLLGCTLSFFLFLPARILICPADFCLQVFSLLMRWIRTLSLTTWICGQPAFWQILVWYMGLLSLLLWTWLRNQEKARGRKRTAAENDSLEEYLTEDYTQLLPPEASDPRSLRLVRAFHPDPSSPARKCLLQQRRRRHLQRMIPFLSLLALFLCFLRLPHGMKLTALDVG